MNLKKRQKITFTLFVDYTQNINYYRNRQYNGQDKYMHFQENYGNKEVKLDMKEKDFIEVKEAIELVVRHKLSDRIKRFYNLEIETDVIEYEEGSVFATIGVFLIGTYEFIANYEDFVNSVEIIQRQAKHLLDKALPYDKYFITTNTDYIMVSKYYEKNKALSFLKKEKKLEDVNDNVKLVINNKRDGFFYFLLFSTIILFAAIGALVYKAVEKTYFL